MPVRLGLRRAVRHPVAVTLASPGRATGGDVKRRPSARWAIVSRPTLGQTTRVLSEPRACVTFWRKGQSGQTKVAQGMFDRPTLAATAVALLVAWAPSALAATTYTAIYSFGDSLSDVGNVHL